MILSPISTVLDCILTFVDEPSTCKFPDTNKLPPNIVAEPELTVNEPVIDVLEFTWNPFELTEAVTAPLAILSNCNPVTPLAGMLYKPAPSPMNEPVNTDEVTG